MIDCQISIFFHYNNNSQMTSTRLTETKYISIDIN
jgi:hypothetical protein